jgi:hypothetical protein
LVNFGSGGAGLIDITGAPRVSFESDRFLRNGDSFKEVMQKTWYSGVINEAASDMTWTQGFNNIGD